METAAFRKPFGFFKLLVFVVWLVLFGLLLKRDYFIGTVDSREMSAISQAEREDYQGIFFNDRKIGYVSNSYTPAKDGTVDLEQTARMTLNVAGTINPIDLHLQAKLGREGKLETFAFTFHSPFYRMRAEGRVTGNTVAFDLSTGSTVIHDKLDLASAPILSTSRRAYLLKKELREGEKFKVPWFDPVSLTAQEAVVEYRGKERVFIRGRVWNLHHFIEVYSGIRVNSWLNDAGEVVKEESPAGFVFIKEPKFKAMGQNDQAPELLSSVSVRVVGAMPSLSNLTRMRYRLQFPDDGSFLLDSGRQHFADGLLTIDLERLSDYAAASGTADGADPTDLASTPYVQANAPQIRNLAAQITAGKTNGIAKVRALAEYVFAHLEKRPVLGIPDALTVLASGKGDCNEHAVLFAALARAAGIPCRIAAGVVYFKDGFYYHAWNEVLLQRQWLSVDATTDQVPADLGHIRFVVGETREQMRIGALLGKLAIEPLAPANEQGRSGANVLPPGRENR